MKTKEQIWWDNITFSEAEVIVKLLYNSYPFWDELSNEDKVKMCYRTFSKYIK